MQRAPEQSEGSSQFQQGTAPPDQGSSQPPPQTAQESMPTPPEPARRRRPKGASAKYIKMPSYRNAEALPKKPTWENRCRELADVDGHPYSEETGMRTMIAIYINRAGTSLEMYRPPSYLYAGSTPSDEPIQQSPNWRENVRRRLGEKNNFFWAELFKVYAPDLHEEMEENGYQLPEVYPDVPPHFFSLPPGAIITEADQVRRLLLFRWSRDNDNHRSLPFNVENDICVIDGHLITVTPPHLFFYFLCF